MKDEDDIMLAVRAAKEEFAASHGFNIRAIVADLSRMDDEGDWPVVSLIRQKTLVASSSLQTIKSELSVDSSEIGSGI